METKTQTVDLSNIKYAIAVEGGGWAYEHTLYLITNDGDAYITEDFKEEDIIPSKKAEADYLGKVDVSKDFVVPEKLQKCVLDAPSVMVFDSNLNKPIYNAFGWEDEFRDYFKEIMELERAFNERKREEAYAKLREERAKKDENGFLLRNENAYSNGKKMTADEFFAMSGMLLDNMDVPDKDVVYDPDGEYENLAKAMGGKVIKLNPSSNDCFNPFDIDDDGIEKEV